MVGTNVSIPNKATMYQIVSENDCDALKTLPDLFQTRLDLSLPDEHGLTPAYLACTLDKPDILKTLHNELNINLSKPCDSMMFGSPSFYAVQHNHVNILETLWELGYDLTQSCDKFENSPLFYAEQNKDFKSIKMLRELETRKRYDFGNSAHVIQRAAMIFLRRKRERG